MINERRFFLALGSCFGCSIDGIWDFLEVEYKPLTFDEQKEAFLEIIKKAMELGFLKLAHNDVFLSGTIEEQIAIFDKKFPKKHSELSDITLSINSNYEFWPPGGGVWITFDNKEIWT